MDIDEIRRTNMRTIEREAGSATAAATKVGMTLAQFSNLRDGAKDSKTGKRRGMHKDTARKIESGAGKPEGWLDRDHSDINTQPGPRVRGPYPLISSVQAGSWAETVDNFPPGDAEEWLESTSDLGPNGFVLRVEGQSMTNPAGGKDNFPEGMLLHIKPGVDVYPGDYVVVKRTHENQVTFKQLANVNGALYLHAINPSWPTPYIALEAGDKIIGKLKSSSWNH